MVFDEIFLESFIVSINLFKALSRQLIDLIKEKKNFAELMPIYIYIGFGNLGHELQIADQWSVKLTYDQTQIDPKFHY